MNNKHGITIARGIRKRTGKRPYSARYGNTTVSFRSLDEAQLCRSLMNCTYGEQRLAFWGEQWQELTEHIYDDLIGQMWAGELYTPTQTR